MRARCRPPYENSAIPPGRIIDLDTGLRIPDVFFFDTDTGEFERYARDERGRLFYDAQTGGLATVKGRGRIAFVPFDKADVPVVVGG
jgi:hypothetical protein